MESHRLFTFITSTGVIVTHTDPAKCMRWTNVAPTKLALVRLTPQTREALVALLGEPDTQ